MFYTFDLVTVGLWLCCCSQAEEMLGVILTECLLAFSLVRHA